MTHQSPAAVASKSTHASEVESITEPTQQMIYQIAGQIILVEAQDTWTAKVIEELFAGWYLTPDTANRRGLLSPAIVIKNSDKPPEIPRHWPQFEVSGGICFTSGKTSYIDIEGSIIAVEKPKVGVHVWTKGRLGTQSPSLTRVVTYALAAALRRRCLFELHSGAVIDPESGRGVLIIGPSGSGKSTLTVQLATAGWSFLTDDVLLLSSEGAEVKSWPMRRCFAITSETFTASNFLQARASIDYIPAQRKNKKQFVPHGVFNSEFKSSAFLKGCFSPKSAAPNAAMLCSFLPPRQWRVSLA